MMNITLRFRFNRSIADVSCCIKRKSRKEVKSISILPNVLIID